MFCPTCKTEMGRTRGRYQFRESGLDFVWLENWPLLECPEGHVKVAILNDADLMNAAIASKLVQEEERLPPEAILFLREAMGMKGQELAQALGVTRNEVSRWENGHNPISPIHDFRLRLEAVDKIVPTSEKREAREKVTFVFQRLFPEKHEKTDNMRISVPPTRELVGATY